MPSAPPWNLNPVTGEANKTLIAGCHITVNAAGTAYQFTEPNPANILSTTTGTSLPTPTFSFPVFTYKGFQWTITVTSLPTNANGAGTWYTAATPEIKATGAQNGDLTAQAGGTIAPGEEEAERKAASSSKPY
jgi:hypothetical protein